MEDAFPHFLLVLVVILGSARLFGGLARLIGQPAVLGELLAGVVIGPSVLFHILGVHYHGGPLIDPKDETLHLLAELGVVILLFEIGLETDVGKLLAVGGSSTVVAVVGVVLPFAIGYAVCHFFGYEPLVGVVAGATLTATSVGITARVLAELRRLQDAESQIILGAAVLDDVIGLIILAVVSASIGGGDIRIEDMAKIAGLSFGFLAAALGIGLLALPALRWFMNQLEEGGLAHLFALLFALAMAFLADWVQPRLTIVGAFAAGLVLAKLPQVHKIEEGIAPIGHFIVPIFFVMTGAAVDVRLLNPLDPTNHAIMRVAGWLLAAAFLGKFLAGYAPFWFKGKKSAIGVGMVPRGEVGLIFANAGKNVVGPSLYSALTLIIMVTTFIVPPLLKFLLGVKRGSASPEPAAGVEDLTVEPA
ncbi:MAG: Na+/H+-exchanging protein [Gemmatales bacterium]|nr:MAG: Na+/H+-exchanging protein [Gemmatales bacterium]